MWRCRSQLYVREGGGRKLKLLDPISITTLDDLFINDYDVLESGNNHIDLAVFFAPPSAKPAAAAASTVDEAPVLVLHLKSEFARPPDVPLQLC